MVGEAEVMNRPVVIKVLSLFLALLLWVYVSNDQKNPQAEREIDVPLENVGPSPDFMITGGMPDNVRIKVQGNSNRLTTLSPDDFQAQIIVTTETAGLVTAPVLVSAPPGLQTQVYPGVVSVYVDTFMEKTVPVVVRTQGEAAPGFAAGVPQARPASVLIRGTKLAVSDVEQVYAVIDIESAMSRIENNLTLSADKAGVTIVPEMARVVVPIEQVLSSKTLPINPRITGNPQEGFKVSEIRAEPSVLQISGLPEQIDGLTELSTEPVDISGADESITVDAPLVAIPGLEDTTSRLIKVQVVIGTDEAYIKPVTIPEAEGTEDIKLQTTQSMSDR